ENQPLLPTHVKDDPDKKSWREQAAELLESRRVHQIVITLVAIDAACVLADLGYTVLSPDCTPEGPEAPEWLEVLAHISLAITTFFLVEIPLSIWAFGAQYYNPSGPVPHASLHIFDSFIIIVTFGLEVGLRGKERELASLLIVLRLWRLVKLVGGIAVEAGELTEDEARELAEAREELEALRAE
ncbi:hypothetical protein FISHEDRAFT_8717, partial [Fistulina hepatica ATCC 64428]